MIGNHFAFAYGHADGWLVLVCLMLVGAWIRHFFNLRHAGRTVWWIPVTRGGGSGRDRRLDQAAGRRQLDGGPPVPLRRSRADRRAALRRASVSGGRQLPTVSGSRHRGQIEAQAEAIERVAVLTRVMPLGNATGMTDVERELLGRWINSLAR